MATQKIFNGASFGTTFAKAPQTAIPGLVALGIFGSGFDNINTNRVVGGSTFANNGSPVTAATYLTVNSNSSTAAGIDTATAETSALVTSGWTVFAVVRQSAASAGGNLTVFQIGTTGMLYLMLQPADTNFSSHRSLRLSGTGIINNTDNGIDIGASADLTIWRFVWAKWPGGTGQSYSFGSLTDTLSKTTSTTYTRTGNASSHFNIGQSNAGLNISKADIPLFGVCNQALTSPQLTDARTFAQGVLGVRGISGF